MADLPADYPLYIPYSGPALLTTSLLNKGSAFSQEERANFNLTGLLPPRYETIEEQAVVDHDIEHAWHSPRVVRTYKHRVALADDQRQSGTAGG